MAGTNSNSSDSQSNIDDLVKELSRPQSPPPLATNRPAPAPINSSPSVPPQTSSGLPPRPPVQSTPNQASSSSPKPSTGPSPVPTRVAPPTAPKEYQSSIRTMSDDLSKLKAGQQPQGVNVPRKIDNTPAPAPMTPKPSSPAPSAKPVPTYSMPSATRTGPVSPLPASSQAPVARTIPRPVMPTMPPPTKTPETQLDQKNQFYVPPAESKPSRSGSRNIIFGGIALLVLIAGLYWFFMIRDSGTGPVVTESPVATFTPRPTSTPNLDVLSKIFTTRGGAIVLPSSGDPTTAFNNAMSAQPNVVPGGLTVIDIVSGASNSAQTLNVITLLNRFVVSYPPALSSALGQNYKFLLYGQKESFDSKGRPVTNGAPGNRLVIVSEIASSSASILRGWESAMVDPLVGIFNINRAKNSSGMFLDSIYKGIVIRYKNFPYPDSSIDYALIQYNNKTYLVIAGSREAMFAVIDAFIVQGK